MGEQRVFGIKRKKDLQNFVRQLLDDVEALEIMIEKDWIEDEIRIGAEQEMALVDLTTLKPAPIAVEALELLKEHEWVESELAKFNLEINADPRGFTGSCLSEMEAEILEKLLIVSEVLKDLNASPLLIGILLSLRKFHLNMSNLTPKKRYKILMDAINEQQMRQAYELRIMGIDELIVKHDSPVLEACNTSFQVHLQVNASNYVKMYNIAQVITSPIMGAAANSPIVFGRRLWHESRIALFQQSLDTRSSHEHMRERSPRVNFGTGWLEKSILEIYKEDIARFRVLLAGDVTEDSLQKIQEGKVPKLLALQAHNGTVYRWNRACYGISENGKPHLRIENRVLPSGPTVLDEMANAALWLGAMTGYSSTIDDITKMISWADARDNFGRGARYGIESKMQWIDGKIYSLSDLLLQEIIPVAKEGLEQRDISDKDIDRYLGVIEERAKKCVNGATWALRSFSNLIEEVSRDEAVSILTSNILKNQFKDMPIHEWPRPKPSDLEVYTPSRLKVDEFMTTDLFTVRKEDIIDLVAEMMDWRKIRYTPVEDKQGKLIGLVTIRLINRYYLKQQKHGRKNSDTVEDIMITDIITTSPDCNILDAMHIMRNNQIGCLPVVKGDELVGIITEMDFLRISSRLIERLEST